MTTDLSDDLRQLCLPIVLYTKLNVECDQRAVGGCRSTVDCTWPRPPSSPGVVNSRPTTVACLSH